MACGKGILSMNEYELTKLISGITPAYADAADAAKKRQATLAKPPHSLGKLEDISIRIAGITGKVNNLIGECRVLVFAADNGVVREGVAVTPQHVTASQAYNMTLHRTGMSVLAAHFGNSISVYDVGINNALKLPGVIDKRIRRGTDSIRRCPAMTRKECLRAIGIGAEASLIAAREGVDAVGVGEMGIGNTTTSAAVLSALTGLSPDAVTGRGSGLTDEAFALKKRVIAEALCVNSPDKTDVIDVISKVGGLDIAAMTGAYLGAAKARIPAVADGFISIVAALCAFRLCPAARDFIFLSHASMEQGYRRAAEELGLEPFLLLDMRLGEGSGCPIAFSVIKAACAVMNDMATFEEAEINDGYLDIIRGIDAFGKEGGAQ